MHPKFEKAGCWHYWGGGYFRLPRMGHATGPTEEPMHAMLNAALVHLLSHPEYENSAIAILEMGVTAGKVRKRVMKDGSISYTFALIGANQHAKRG